MRKRIETLVTYAFMAAAILTAGAAAIASYIG